MTFEINSLIEHSPRLHEAVRAAHLGSLAVPGIVRTTFEPKHRTKNGIRLFGPEGIEIQDTTPERPLRILVITSIRDIASEGAGKHLNVRGKETYFKGSLQALAEASLNGLGKFVEIAGVVVDDVPGKDKVETRGYEIMPDAARKQSRLWIAPDELPINRQQTLGEATVHIPSSFRKLTAPTDRIREKFKFECAVAEHAQSIGADFILSDHCLVRFESLHRHPQYLGKVFNIHPAITWAGDPNPMRGLTVTADTLKRAKDTGYLLSGGTLHCVGDVIDGGEVVADCENMLIDPERDNHDSFRVLNYRHSKIPALLTGLAYLSCNFLSLSRANADLLIGNQDI